MNEKNLVLIGGGGHCKSVISSLDKGDFNQIVIVDSYLGEGTELLGVKVVGNDNILPKLRDCGFKYAFLSLGSIGNTTKRRVIVEKIKKIGYEFINIIDKDANISDNVSIGIGCFIGKNAILNSNVHVGDHCIINTGAIVEHDCSLDSFVHIATGAILCGGCKIENDAHIGAGSCVKQGIRVKNNSIVGMGSVVIRNVPEKTTVAGCPASKI